MALKEALKRRLAKIEDDRQFGSMQSVDTLMSRVDRDRPPRKTGNPVSRQTSEVIEKAFEFLKGSVYGSRGSYDLDRIEEFEGSNETDQRGSTYRKTWSRRSDERYGGVSMDRRYPYPEDDAVNLRNGPSCFTRPRKNQISSLVGIPETNGSPPNYELNRAVMLPRVGGRMYPVENDYRSYRHPDLEARPPPREGFDDYMYQDDRSEYADGRDRNGIRPGSVYRKSGKPGDGETTAKPFGCKRCLFVAILIAGLVIIAGVVTVLVLHFIGFFSSSPTYQDGYDVTAIFSNPYQTAWTDPTTEEFKNEADSFINLTESILDNSTYKDSYRVELQKILPGSTKYLYTIELVNRTDAELLKTTLKDGYRNAFIGRKTELVILDVIIKQLDVYTTIEPPEMTESVTELPGTTINIEEGVRTTPAPVAVCRALQKEECKQFGYSEFGTENTSYFADLDLIVSKGCYKHSLEYVCVLAYPPCENRLQRYPCRRFCEEFRTNCSFPLPCEAYLDDDSADLCYPSPEPTPTEETVTRNPLPESCESYEFQCGTGNCMPSNVQCDGNEDCVDNSDELFCQDHTDIGLDCDFSDNNICSYTNDDSGHFNWMLNKGRTPSLNTGPLTDHTTRNDEGLYLYAEASGQYAYSVARIKSTQVSPGTDWCLRFYYHMFGDQIGALKVYQSDVDSEDERLLWQRSRDQGDKWIFSAVTLPAGTYHVIFEAIRGEGYKSDIAIDDITAREGACPQTAQGCSDDQFSCDNGNCIQQSYVCNSVNDCGDYSDERSCNCTSSEFQCEIGMCIPLYLRCDSKKQCPDGSDEDGCDSVCSNGRHKCNDGTCILPEWVCDHESDCPDNSDEVNCPICASGEWQCRDNKCVMESMVCDGRKDCVDGSDEVNCFRLSDDGLVEVRKRSPDHWTPICSYGFKAILYDDICKLIGHEKSTSFGVKSVVTDQYVRYSESSVAENLLQQLVTQYSCPDFKVISITCSEKDCGQPTDDRHIEAYIVHGNDATIGQWPWQIALYVYHQSTWLFSCGGSLVSHYHVITAAHCVKLYSDPAMYKVVLGKTLLNAADTGIEVIALSIMKHAEFETPEWGSDIAVLFLEEYIEFSDVIKPICLPSSADDLMLTSQCYVSGWGTTDFYDSSSLQETKMKLWSDDQCSAAYINYNNEMVCAGYESGYTGNCQGDDGGPLQCRGADGRWKLFGVFSYVVDGCNIPNQPPVFTRVKSYREWLDEKLNIIVYECNFEENTCSLALSSNTIPMWHWFQVPTSEIATDHTTASTTGHVLYLNTTLVGQSQVATVSFSVKLEFVSCLTFYYDMNSSGTLLIEVFNGTLEIIFHKQRVMTAGWQEVQLELEKAVTIIQIYGYTGQGTDSFKNYIALDDISINHGRCSNTACRPHQFKCANGKCINKALMCDNKDDCTDNSDEEDSLCKDITKMSPDMFRCDDGTYRQRHLRCDGQFDCSDHSDEINCTAPYCKEDEFQCLDGKCKHKYSKKDGYNDCSDGSDESGGCESYQFTCASGQCIAGFRYCDGNVDCPDASDEPASGCQCNPRFHFTCGDGKCIPKEFACDGDNIAHCSDLSDENPNRCTFKCLSGVPSEVFTSQVCNAVPQCTNGEDEGPDCECPFGYLPCVYGGCVPETKICDGHYDCYDHSDEANCTCTGDRPYRCESGMCLLQTARCNQIVECDDWSDELNCSPDPGCPDGYFACKNGVCVRNDVKCDGQDDCGDISDEINCDCNPVKEYKCEADGVCIPLSWKCDRINDCSDRADEEATCGGTCNPDQFQCNVMEYSCISSTLRCNGVYDCSDGSDEKSCERFSEAGLFEVLNNSEWITICSSGWSTQWNNDVCRHIGKGATIQASEVAVTKDKYLIVKPGLTGVTNPVFTLDMLQLAEDCPTSKGIYLSCAEPVCGVLPSPPSALIIGGQTSSPNTWPWMAAILHAGKPLCGAALIDSQWLITAAHCFKSQLLDDGKLRYTPHYIKVVTGTTKLSYPNTTTARSDTSRLELDVQSIIIHPDFHVNTYYALFNDIALVKLKEPITDTNVKYICRPTKYDHLPNKAKCYTAGWGLVDYKIGNVRIEDLRETRLNLWENNDCSRLWGTDVNTTIHLCAGSTAPRPTVCEGDSGGPLMCRRENDIWQLAGVTSFVERNCGQTSDIKPVIFTRVGTYSDWIDNQISTT